jgi:hypothetical protein
LVREADIQQGLPARKEVEMWGSFACPQCHRLLRVRRNFTIRILRLVVITVALVFLVEPTLHWLREHIGLGIFVTGGTSGVTDEYVMRLLPTRIESATPGGFATS